MFDHLTSKAAEISENIVVSIIAGVGMVVTAAIGAVVAWRKSLAEVETARLAKIEEVKQKEKDRLLKEAELKQHEIEYKNEAGQREVTLSNMMQDTYRDALENLHKEIVLRDENLTRERTEHRERVLALVAEKGTLTAQFSEQQVKLAQATAAILDRDHRIQTLTANLEEYSRGLDICIAQIQSYEKDPVYKKRNTIGPITPTS